MTLNSRWGLWCVAIFGFLMGAGRLTTPLAAEEAQTYQLRYQFTAGQEWHYVSQTDSEFMVEFQQTKDTVPHTSMFIRHVTVIKANPDGSAEVELLLDKAHMTAVNSGVSSLYDSEYPEHVPTEFANVHASLGVPRRAVLSAQGKVRGDSDKSVAELLFQLPDMPVTIGATWQEKFEVSIPVDNESKLLRSVKLQRRYELKSVEQGIATIGIMTACLSPINNPYQESLLIQRKPSGTVKFDIGRGCLVDRQLTIDDKVVGNQGAGSALTVKLIKVDRLVNADQLRQVDLTKPLVPLRVAADPAKAFQ